MGFQYIVQTDDKTLKNLMEQVVLTLEQQHYLTKLLGFGYSITYKPGKDNLIADAVSRQTILSQTDPTTRPGKDNLIADALSRKLFLVKLI